MMNLVHMQDIEVHITGGRRVFYECGDPFFEIAQLIIDTDIDQALLIAYNAGMKSGYQSGMIAIRHKLKRLIEGSQK